MVTFIYYFLLSLGADALIHDLRGYGIFDSNCITIDGHTYKFAKADCGYSVSYDGGNPVYYKRTWQQVQQECIHADCAHRQAEEDNTGDEEDQRYYEEATKRLQGCKAAYELITGIKGANYWYAPEKQPNW